MKNTGHPINAIPLDKHLAILGTTGSGKSYTARILVERLLGLAFENQTPMPRVCILDPKGDWFGLRLDKDGKKKGEDFTIIGGPHADEGLRLDDDHPEPMAVPLAQLVAGSDARTVIDLSDLDAGKMRRFVAAFLKTLYHENRRPLTLLVDEADEFAPQQPKGESAISLGAMERIAKRGRARGVRLWMVTQRPASLHKDVLGMAQTVVAMKMGLPHDRKAVKEWIAGQVGGVDHKAQESIEKAVVDSLPTLKTGEGWVWVMGQVPERVKFPTIRTFDSMRTPTEGDDFGLITLPPIDAGKLSAELAKVVKENAENDPKALKARIVELEKQLKAAPANVDPEGIVIEGKAVEWWINEAKTLRSQAVDLIHEREALQNQLNLIGSMASDMTGELDRVYNDFVVRMQEARNRFGNYSHALRSDVNSNPLPPTNQHHVIGTDGRAQVHGPTGTTQAAAAAKVERPAPDSGLTAPQQKILDTVLMLERRGIVATRDSVARWMDIHPNGGSYGANLGHLRSTWHLDGMALTDAGREAANEQPTGFEAALAALPTEPLRAICRMLQSLGNPQTREQLAGALKLHPNGGGYGANLGRLRTMGLITARGPIALTPEAFR